jgi:hypothetical protein
MSTNKSLTITKKFQGSTEAGAIAAAKRWSADLSSHGEVQVENIETIKKGGAKFVATITYLE